ncbi:MAG: UDP-N-acetylglucosamine--N-acetylmuramyl-(pentapeptide) pyrophosphoryl-undecaprenol N-acetylglucosamine transferase [bacterium]
MKTLSIAVSCGGTGGHVFPGLATACELRKRGHAVTLWLAGQAVEGASLAGWDGPLVTIPASGLAGGLAARGRAVWSYVGAFKQARAELRARRPDVLLAMGSYSSVGPVLAARLAGVPVVLHESNAVPGRALSALAPLASCVAVHFEAAAAFVRARRVVVTGMPIRAELEEEAEAIAFADARRSVQSGPDRLAPFTLLVMGGSQGAVRLNASVVEALRLLAKRGAAPAVIHLAGPRNAVAVRAAYVAAGVAVEVLDFCQDMASVYRRTDAAISRSGAASCAELALFGRPSILVPYPEAARDHQRANARAIETAGGAWLLDQAAATPAALAAGIERLRTEATTYHQMAAALRRLCVPHAAARLADVVENITG